MDITLTLLGSAFVTGLVGSLHCVGMCGPLAGTISLFSSDKSKNIFLQFAYNSGRLFSYSLIGMLLGALGERTNLTFSFLLPVQEVTAWIGISVLMFLGISLLFGKTPLSAGFLGKIIGKIAKPFLGELTSSKPGLSKTILLGFGFGFVTGFLPCGILYPAFVTAFASGNPLLGAGIMMCFFLGTFPLLFLFGVGFKTVFSKWRGKLVRYAGGVVVMVSIFMILFRFGHDHSGHSPAAGTSSQEEMHHHHEHHHH